MSLDTCASLLVEIISAVATTAAVFVALSANKKSNEQLNKALRMHEQTKSVELLDKRKTCVQKIRSGRDISEEDISILFDEKIVSLFSILQESKKELTQVQEDLTSYDLRLQREFPDATQDSPYSRIIKAKCAPGEKAAKEYEELCKQYEREVPARKPGEEPRVLNHKKMMEKIEELQKTVKKNQQKLEASMIEFIKQSIEPLIKEEK